MSEHISYEEAEHLADLARLHITREEAEQLQLDTVIEYVARVQKLSTDGVKPFSELHNAALELRADRVEPFAASAELLAGETTETGLLAVKQIFDHER